MPNLPESKTDDGIPEAKYAKASPLSAPATADTSTSLQAIRTVRASSTSENVQLRYTPREPRLPTAKTS